MASRHPRQTVVGIDVGGAKKGFHAVALENGAYLDRKKSSSVSELVEWCENRVIPKRASSAASPAILRRMSRMTRPSRVRRNLISRRARLNWWAWV